MSEQQWGGVSEWTELPAHPTSDGEYRYRRVAHRDGVWHGLQVEQKDRNGRWVAVGKDFGRGFAVGRLVPESEWPSFKSGAQEPRK